VVVVQKVDFVQIPTRDVAGAAAWYHDVLRLPISATTTRDAEVDTPNVTLRFWRPEEMGVPFRPNLGAIALQVDDVAAARRVLEEDAGVEFVLATYDSGVCHLALFRDPDGNHLILHHRYTPRATDSRT